MISSTGGTGIEHWWTYEARPIPGIGKAFVNVGTGNLIVSALDVDIPERGIDLAFQRTYNSQSLHDYNGDDGGDRAIFGNFWTNNFDANLVYNSAANTLTVYDLDGTACVYTAVGGNWQPCAGERASLAPTDSTDCTYAWTKTDGTVYWFHADNNGGPSCSVPQSKKGRIQKIFGRNYYNNITFAYSYSGSGQTAENITEIDADHSDGQSLIMQFGVVPGTTINELATITRPDGGVLQYSYDTSGNLTEVDKPGNNSASSVPSGHGIPTGDVPETYSYLTGTSALQQACGPRCTIAEWQHPNSPQDGAALLFSLDSSNRLVSWQEQGILNFTPGDGTSTLLQPGISSSNQAWYTGQFVYGPTATPCGAISVSQTAMCDTDNHSTVWTTDSSLRVTETQDWTGSNEGVWITTSQTWDANSNLQTTTDARGHTTQYGYDGMFNLTRIALPSPTSGAAGQGPTSTYNYDSLYNILSYCDPIYNNNHSGACPTGQTNGTTSMQYDYSDANEPSGRLITMYMPLGYERQISYNASNQGAGGTQVGLPTQVLGNGGAAIAQADGTSRTPQQNFTYDGLGNLKTYTKGENTWAIQYDSLNRGIIRSDGDSFQSVFPAAGISNYTCYYADGSVAYTETQYQHQADGSGSTCPSSVNPAPTAATSNTYDADGDQISIVDHKGGATGTTTKYYDGLDRLVEVALPHDSRSGGPIQNANWDYFSFKWLTRYFYDLTQGTGTVSINLKNSTAQGLAYGNLFKTVELLPSSPIQYGNQTPTLSQWTDVRGNFFDGVDRSIAKYEAAVNDSSAAEFQSVYDASSYAGLLTKTTNGEGQTESYHYDYDDRKSEVDLNNSYSPGQGVSPPPNDTRTYGYDADSRVTSVQNTPLGAMSYVYDLDGNLASVAQATSVPGASRICYTYYSDDVKEYISTGTACPNGSQSPGGISQSDILAYSYRNDNLLQTEAYNWTAQGSFKWSYTPAGRELTLKDPLTGAPVPTWVGLTPGSYNYIAKKYTYDPYGRAATMTLPESYAQGSSTSPITYDTDDEVTGFSEWNNGNMNSGGQRFQGDVHTFTLNVRGEMLCDVGLALPNPGGPSSCGSSANGQWLANVNVWDARANMSLGGPFWFPNASPPPTFGSSNYIYDRAGRQATGWYSTQQYPTPAPSPPSGNVPPFTHSYDAENHVVNAAAPSYLDANFSTCANSLTQNQCQPNATFAWGPDGHLKTIANINGTYGLHYDGDALLFTSDGHTPTLYLGAMGVLDASGTLNVWDRDASGTLQSTHATSWFGPWNLGAAYPQYKNNLNIDFAPGSCAPPLQGQNNCVPYLPVNALITQNRTDGYGYGTYTFQGVRIFDTNSSQWLTPDAFAGDVDDPTSQKPFMWNGNNPISYSDPTGYLINWGDSGITQDQYNDGIRYFQSIGDGNAALTLLDLELDPNSSITIKNTSSLDDLADSFTEGSITAKAGDFLTGTISWNPKGALSDYNGKGSAESPFMSLLHEGGHALDYIRDPQAYEDGKNPFDPIWTNSDERQNILYTENPALKAAGMPLRVNHITGHLCPVSTPSSVAIPVNC